MSILKWTDFTTALDELDIWPILARPNQLPPPGEDWFAWLLLAGRGFGKTRALVEFVREKVAAGAAMRVALVAPTAADARNILVEGASGILACSPPWFRPSFEPSKRRLTWPSGTIATLYSADEPERLRGPQHDLAAVDELGSWRYQEAWDNLMLGLRLGDRPLCAVATTPRPTKLIKDLVNREGAGVVVTRGTSYENRSNLAPQFFDLITKKYEGTRLGRQELMGELLVDVPGALWKLDQLERLRRSQAPELQRIVVAIDPSGSGSEEADECGIVVAGVDGDSHAWILADASGKYQPTEWAKRAIELYYELGADRIVAETNFGGQMVEATMRAVDRNVAYCAVTASRGKVTRAEPVAALYEQGRVHHVGTFPELEDQMCAFTVPFNRARAGFSPGRVDALVWALTDLVLQPMNSWGMFELTRRQALGLPVGKSKPATEAAQSLPQPGSMEWFAAQRKSS
jgi:phage terminase large subunit-like protein